MLAVDASLIVELSLDRIDQHASEALGSEQLIAPSLLWSEVPSVLHELAFRADISRKLADWALERFLTGEIEVDERRPEGLTTAAWHLADEFDWVKTYDPEYVALARLLSCQLVTVDENSGAAPTDSASSSRPTSSNPNQPPRPTASSLTYPTEAQRRASGGVDGLTGRCGWRSAVRSAWRTIDRYRVDTASAGIPCMLGGAPPSRPTASPGQAGAKRAACRRPWPSLRFWRGPCRRP